MISTIKRLRDTTPERDHRFRVWSEQETRPRSRLAAVTFQGRRSAGERLHANSRFPASLCCGRQEDWGWGGAPGMNLCINVRADLIRRRQIWKSNSPYSEYLSLAFWFPLGICASLHYWAVKKIYYTISLFLADRWTFGIHSQAPFICPAPVFPSLSVLLWPHSAIKTYTLDHFLRPSPHTNSDGLLPSHDALLSEAADLPISPGSLRAQWVVLT